MAEPFIGEIKMFGGNFAPLGWAFCNGQLLPIAQYDALYNLIGTTYGGDGQTTFALPNLQGRTPIHVNSAYPQGAVVGSEAVTLTQLQMATHNHLAAALTGAGGNSKPDGAVWAGSSVSDNKYTDTLNAGTTFNPATIQNTGGNQPHDNMQPFLVINFIIALEGIYPTQG